MGSFGNLLICSPWRLASVWAVEYAADIIVAREGKVLLGKSFRINAKLRKMGIGEGVKKQMAADERR
jgi:hypothetical protein